jgi:hypothetical protein
VTYSSKSRMALPLQTVVDMRTRFAI